MGQITVIMNFEDYHWHDAQIKNIEIDRSNLGNKDIVSFELNWADKGSGRLIFEEVYWSRLNLNFGIVASECIDNAFVTEQNDEDLINLYKLWTPMIGDINLTCYVIKTISTGSEIKIIAKGFKVLK
jgi:hypothetical protein